MADIIFYTNPMSRGRITRWLLEELGQPYETVVLDYGTTMKDPSFLSLNPMGKVPAIVHKGQVVTEGAAIAAYLADATRKPAFCPRPTPAPAISAGCSSLPARLRPQSSTARWACSKSRPTSRP